MSTTDSKTSATPARRARDARRQVRAEQITNAAREVIDQAGLESLTMRKLADRLDLGLPMIYRLFESKQAILDQLAESILAAALASSAEVADWEQRTLDLAHSLRGALLAQRDGARIVGGSYTAQQHTLAFAEQLVGTMRQAGFRDAMALWATTTVFCYVLGEALEQQGADKPALSAVSSAGRAAAGLPHLTSTPLEELLSFDRRFEFGIGVVISGLRARLSAA